MAFEELDNQKIIVARIQNRRGRRVNLPQPLLPGEFGWCIDTKQIFIGINPENAPTGVEIYRGEPAAVTSLIEQGMTTKLFTFKSVPTVLTTDEVAILARLAKVPALYYVDDSEKSKISDLERQIDLIRSVKTSVFQSVSGASESYAMLYDWVEDNGEYVFTFTIGSKIDNLFNLTTIGNNSFIDSNTVKNMTAAGYELYRGSITVDTNRESANIAVLINQYIADANNSYVTTKQNIEILTEYSDLFNEIDTLIQTPVVFELAPSSSYIQVQTIPVLSGGNFGTNPFEFMIEESDTFEFTYSVAYGDTIDNVMQTSHKFVQSGQLRVVSSVLNNTSIVSDDSTEYRPGVNGIEDGGFDISFKSVINGDKVQLMYKHNFPSRVLLKIFGKRWASFDTVNAIFTV